MNNLKEIREMYGATQEEIASAIGVNRVTVANWELGKSTPSSANQEKLSLYYGIGPEFFFEESLNDTTKKMIMDTAAKAEEIVVRSEGKRNKAREYRDIFECTPFPVLMKRYMTAMKMLLASADQAEVKDLKTALLINQKMGRRLQAFISVRTEEEKASEPTLIDLLDQIE